MNDDFGVEIYDPTAQGSDLSESSMFHNPEVIADNVDESLKELEKENPGLYDVLKKYVK